jgi:hypothetical protein
MMMDVLKKHPAIYVAVIGAMATCFVHVSSKLGLPLSPQMAAQLAQIIGGFFAVFILYLAAHAHGGQMGAAFQGAIQAGADEAEKELEADAPKMLSPGAGPGAPTS